MPHSDKKQNPFLHTFEKYRKNMHFKLIFKIRSKIHIIHVLTTLIFGDTVPHVWQESISTYFSYYGQ